MRLASRKKAPSGNGRLRRRANAIQGCPLTAALSAVGGKWKLVIVYWLGLEDEHFAGLRRPMPGTSPKVLTQQLPELEADGLVQRRPQGLVPAPVLYALTEYGRSLLPLVESVRVWGGRHFERFVAM